MADEKKPRKPWHRPQNIVFAILLAFFFLLAFAVFWALTAEPAPNVDYGAKLERIAAEAQAPGENGWPKLVQALAILESIEASFDAVDRPEEHSPRIDYSLIIDADASPEAVAMVREAVQRLRDEGAFDRLAEAAECPNVVRPWPDIDEGPLLGSLLPDLAMARQIAKARMASMHTALEDGDMDEVVAAFEQTAFLCRAYSHQPTLIDSLVGQAIAALASQQIRHALREGGFDEPTLQRLLDVAGRSEALAPMPLGLEGERQCVLDTIQRTCTGGGTFLPTQLGETLLSDLGNPTVNALSDKPRLFNLAGLAFAGRQELTDKTNTFFDEVIRRWEMPRQERLAEPSYEYGAIQNLSWRFTLLKLLVPAVENAINSRDAVDCELAATQLMLAIELYHAEKGRYPQSLSELTPDILPELPADPFSPDGFLYRITIDDEHDRPYMLYSVGADGVDNGGRVDDDRPNSALSERDGADLDFVINAPRPVE